MMEYTVFLTHFQLYRAIFARNRVNLWKEVFLIHGGRDLDLMNRPNDVGRT